MDICTDMIDVFEFWLVLQNKNTTDWQICAILSKFVLNKQEFDKFPVPERGLFGEGA